MLYIYRFFINITFILSPIIIIFRLFRKKEHPQRFKEKLCFFSRFKKKGKLIWFHGASVGEIQSIIPLIEKFEKKGNISNILITSNTLSSSRIIEKFKFKKVIHQFFPIDTNFNSKKFLNYWRPSAVFFIDSEIWPNTIINLYKKKIPIVLLNGRITKKTFERWKNLPRFSNFLFSKINLCFASSNISKNYLKKLGVKNIKFFGNLKFSQSENEKIIKFKKLERFISSKKIWCASSTHYNEEKFCGIVHKKLKKKYKNLLTIIIPRHIERTELIKDELNKLNLITHKHNSKNKIHKNTDIYIVNSYGQTKSIYNICKNVFLGGSLINHGGQNPLEATRYGCNILHGPNTQNFKEIYDYLNKLNVSSKINSISQLASKLNKFMSKNNNSRKIKIRLTKIGKEILNNTYNDIDQFLKNENYKT